MEEQEIIFSVAEFSTALKGLVEGTFKRVKVRGEITGLKRHSSGTQYFDLKESFGGKDYILACVLWRWTDAGAKLEEGLEVVITGRATTYSGRSSYQLVVEAAEIAGAGALFKIIEERKKKLGAEGLFDAARKKPLPRYPRVVGVVSSPSGAVIRDIIHRLGERWPCRAILWGAAVQGDGAELEIASAIRGLNALGGADRPDVIIVARGGGSLQDLMPFNSEEVVRAAAESSIPLISAVGHETDTTLIDYASDLRAPTPTAAAEMATPERGEILTFLAANAARMAGMARSMCDNFALRVRAAAGRVANPAQYIGEARQRLDDKWSRADAAVSNRIGRVADRIGFFGKMLESYSFRNVLDRGYSIAWNGGEVVGGKAELERLGAATLELKDGKVDITVAPCPPAPPHAPRQREDLFDL
jgi:exodeoxyribonuclease VII large subunit